MIILFIYMISKYIKILILTIYWYDYHQMRCHVDISKKWPMYHDDMDKKINKAKKMSDLLCHARVKIAF